MSFALRIDSAPRALAQRLHVALAFFALFGSIFATAFAEPEQRGAIVLASLACFAIAAGRRRFSKTRGPADGSLAIDEQGRASWSDARGGERGQRAVRIERWNVFGPLAWLRLRVAGESATIDVMFSRFGAGGIAADPDDWRRLRAWLLWYGRGATRADTPPASTTGPQ